MSLIIAAETEQHKEIYYTGLTKKWATDRTKAFKYTSYIGAKPILKDIKNHQRVGVIRDIYLLEM